MASAKQLANQKKFTKMVKAAAKAKKAAGGTLASEVAQAKKDLATIDRNKRKAAKGDEEVAKLKRAAARHRKAMNARTVGFTNRTLPKRVRRLKNASWAARRGAGKPKPGEHIPLYQLKINLKRLAKTVKDRDGKPEWGPLVKP